MTKSALQIARAAYKPKVPAALNGAVIAVEGEYTQSVADRETIKQLFPHTCGMPIITFRETNEKQKLPPINVGVILSGGQAPGGHNVIAGLFDGIKAIHPDSRLFGFILGPGGLINHQYKELTANIIDEYRNTGGFDMIGSGRTKLETEEQFRKGLEILKQLNISALVIVGGDDSNTNACVLAEYYKEINAGVQVIGCPKTIDGDLKNEQIETSFGFDTACKVYSEVIGNIERDCNSAQKYWHFIKLMGRSASHIALECALQTQPNLCIISEEVEKKELSLDDIVTHIATIVAKRAEAGNNFGTILIPEGLIEFVPAIKRLIAELNDYLGLHDEEFKMIKRSEQRAYIISKLSENNAALYASLPEGVARQLTLDRDPHGNVQVSLIETEKLLSEMVGRKLSEWKKEGKYKGKFSAQHHFFGYEGRCAAPSNYDADYCYSLGYTASCLIAARKTGYMASVRNTTAPANAWIAGGIPITMMMNMEKRHGEMKPVIQKALVKLDGAPFRAFAAKRDEWASATSYVYPGPIQYFGPTEVCDKPTITLQLEQNEKPARNEDPEYEADVRKYGKNRADHRANLRAELARMTVGRHEYPFEGCTEPELSDWWNEYNAEFR
jgi:pyrophosphate--fructose-6-phosphate 1-phosphotransferase